MIENEYKNSEFRNNTHTNKSEPCLISGNISLYCKENVAIIYWYYPNTKDILKKIESGNKVEDLYTIQGKH